MEALLAVLGKIDNPLILVLILLCAGLSYLHVLWRKEEREDRQRMVEVFGSLKDAINEMRVSHKDAINEMRVTLAAFLGKAQ